MAIQNRRIRGGRRFPSFWERFCAGKVKLGEFAQKFIDSFLGPVGFFSLEQHL